jgi:hypothetical protein
MYGEADNAGLADESAVGDGVRCPRLFGEPLVVADAFRHPRPAASLRPHPPAALAALWPRWRLAAGQTQAAVSGAFGPRVAHALTVHCGGVADWLAVVLWWQFRLPPLRGSEHCVAGSITLAPTVPGS